MPLSNEEKQLVKQMKFQLQMMSVPRSQWASIIQEKLHSKRKEIAKQEKIQNRGSLAKFLHSIFAKIKNLFKNTLMKFMLRKQGINMDANQMDALQKMMSTNGGGDDGFGFNDLNDGDLFSSMDDEMMEDAISSIFGQVSGSTSMKSRDVDEMHKRSSILKTSHEIEKKKKAIIFEDAEEGDDSDDDLDDLVYY